MFYWDASLKKFSDLNLESVKTATRTAIWFQPTSIRPGQIRSELSPNSNSLLGGECSSILARLGGRGYYLHLLPVVRKFSAAIQASYVGSGQCAGLRPARGAPKRHWEAVTRVSATENRVNQFCNHKAPSTETGFSGMFPSVVYGTFRLTYTQSLRFKTRRNGFVFFSAEFLFQERADSK